MFLLTWWLVNIYYIKYGISLQHFHMCTCDYSVIAVYMCTRVSTYPQKPLILFWVRVFPQLGDHLLDRLVCPHPHPLGYKCVPPCPPLFVMMFMMGIELRPSDSHTQHLSNWDVSQPWSLHFFLDCRKWSGFCTYKRHCVQFKFQCPVWPFIETPPSPFTYELTLVALALLWRLIVGYQWIHSLEYSPSWPSPKTCRNHPSPSQVSVPSTHTAARNCL